MTDSSVTTESHTQERILEAAKLVFAEKGYHAARVSDIVEQAGVAQGTFYLYFKSKQAIFTSLVDTFFSQLLEEALSAAPIEAVTSPEQMLQQVHNVWRIILRHFRDDRSLAYLILREARCIGPEFEERIQAYYQQAVGWLADYASKGAKLGLVRPLDPQLAAWAVLGMFERTVYQLVVLEGRDDIELMADQLLELELRGLMADGAKGG